MTPDADTQSRFLRIEAAVDAALDQPAEQRIAMLRAACAGDDSLFGDAMALLEAIDASEGYLEHPPRQDAAPVPAAEPRIGPWRLLRQVGRGGVGDVWLAERDDGQFDQQVAIKLLRHVSDQDVPRFLREQRTLARFDHRGIARLIDAGTTANGRPYMAMEFVDGVTITEFCRVHGASLEQRLILFIQVCDAVAYAHRHLVVPRDLKPQNILVRGSGSVVLLDFGIARLLDGDDTQTLSQSASMTPRYAAPEQLDGRIQTTQTDVYSLGLLLYELLAGRLPWQVDATLAPLALLQRALAGPPPAPSSVVDGADRSRLRGDLDAIVAKALRPEPEARYVSVEMLQEDIERFRAHQPVRARGDAFGYRLRRALRRYWIAAALSAAILIGLLMALWIVADARRTAERERDVAQTEARRSKAVRDYLAHMFRDAGDRAHEGAPLTAKQVLDQAAARVESSFSANPADAADVLKALGELHFYIDDYAAAEPLLRRWLARDAEIGDATAAADVRFTLAESLHRMGRSDEARTLLSQAQDYWSRAPERHADVLLTSRMLQSQLERQHGDTPTSIATLEAALPLRLARSGKVHVDTATLYTNLGAAYIQAGKFEQGIAMSEQALKVWNALNLDAGNDALNTRNNLAAAAFRVGDLDRAQTYFEQALALRREAYGPSAATAALIGNYARVLQKRNQYRQALALIDEGEPMAVTHAGERSPLTLALRLTRAELLIAVGRWSDAEAIVQPLLDAVDLPAAIALRARIAAAYLAIHAGKPASALSLLQQVQLQATAMAAQAQPYAADISALQTALREAFGSVAP